MSAKYLCEKSYMSHKKNYLTHENLASTFVAIAIIFNFVTIISNVSKKCVKFCSSNSEERATQCKNCQYFLILETQKICWVMSYATSLFRSLCAIHQNTFLLVEDIKTLTESMTCSGKTNAKIVREPAC